jgi:Helix-turn-helix domain
VKQFLGAAQIATLTGMSVRSIRRWIANEILPSTKVRGARLVAHVDLDRLFGPHQGSSERDNSSDEHER